MSAQNSPPIGPPNCTPEEYLQHLIASKMPEERLDTEMIGWAGTYWMQTLHWIKANSQADSFDRSTLLANAKLAHNRFFGKYSALIPREED